MFNFLDKHAVSIGLIYVAFTGFWAIYKFRQSLRDKRFKIYHDLLKQLVDEAVPKLDRQIAVIFELRHFPDYYEVSKRILKGLKVSWKDNHRITNEIDITLDYMRKGKIKRFVQKLRKVTKETSTTNP